MSNPFGQIAKKYKYRSSTVGAPNVPVRNTGNPLLLGGLRVFVDVASVGIILLGGYSFWDLYKQEGFKGALDKGFGRREPDGNKGKPEGNPQKVKMIIVE